MTDKEIYLFIYAQMSLAENVLKSKGVELHSIRFLGSGKELSITVQRPAPACRKCNKPIAYRTPHAKPYPGQMVSAYCTNETCDMYHVMVAAPVRGANTISSEDDNEHV